MRAATKDRPACWSCYLTSRATLNQTEEDCVQSGYFALISLSDEWGRRREKVGFHRVCQKKINFTLATMSTSVSSRRSMGGGARLLPYPAPIQPPITTATPQIGMSGGKWATLE